MIKKKEIQVDSSYHICRTELQLIDLRKNKVIDSIGIDNDFGRIIILGNKKTSRLYTPLGVKVLKKKCISKKKQKSHAIEEFERNIIKKN